MLAQDFLFIFIFIFFLSLQIDMMCGRENPKSTINFILLVKVNIN